VADPTFFEELLAAPDRDNCPGAGRIVSYHADEAPEELARLEQEASALVSLSRRGVRHGRYAEFEPADSTSATQALFDERWHGARPLLLPELVEPLSEELCAERQALFKSLAKPRGLRAFLEAKATDLMPEFLLGSDLRSLEDASRDLAGVGLEPSPRRGEPTPQSGPPWAKSGRLSTFGGDASLRLRLGFGEHGADDASRDQVRLRQVTRLAEALFPETQALHEHPQLGALLSKWLGHEPAYSQHIAYWNAPQGGALFHHDSFDESADGGQRGVLYAQQSGWTFWLAVSIDDLARRSMEFVEYLAEPDLAPLRKLLYPDPEVFERVQSWCKPGRFARLRGELAKPRCGALSSLVNRGPEFSGFLADAGHGYLLGPGDGILLPNHGYDATCMHSVFCAGPEVGFGLSLALRSSADRSPPRTAHPATRSSRKGRPRRGR
jgi:hypothetical protein